MFLSNCFRAAKRKKLHYHSINKEKINFVPFWESKGVSPKGKRNTFQLTPAADAKWWRGDAVVILTFRIAVVVRCRVAMSTTAAIARRRCGEERSDFATTFEAYAMFGGGTIWSGRRRRQIWK